MCNKLMAHDICVIVLLLLKPQSTELTTIPIIWQAHFIPTGHLFHHRMFRSQGVIIKALSNHKTREQTDATDRSAKIYLLDSAEVAHTCSSRFITRSNGSAPFRGFQ